MIDGVIDGMMIDPLRIHGTPHDPGPYHFTLIVEDLTSGCRGERTYDPNCPLLSIAPAVLANGTVGVAYLQKFDVTGGTGPYTFSISGTTPPGLTLTGDTLSGVPTTAGTYAFDITVFDQYCCSTTIHYCALDVDAATCPLGTSIVIIPPALPPASPGIPYAQAITPAGGTAPYTFAVTSGALPPGFGLGPMTGIISGVTAAKGSFAFVVTVTDANGCSASICYDLSVADTIPALSPWALCILSALLACAGWAVGRR